MEDDRVAILEAQLAQAKLIAEEADKKYEEVKFYYFYNFVRERLITFNVRDVRVLTFPFQHWKLCTKHEFHKFLYYFV